MMNAIWGLMLISGLIFGLVGGMGSELVDAMTTGCANAVMLCLELCGSYMFWMGIMEVLNGLGAIDALAKIMRPVMKKLFPGEKDAIAPITLNLAANFFGLGSAATPFGLEAMKELQKTNPNKSTASNSMCMFIALNASALELLPTGVVALRTASGSVSPYSVVVPTFIASVASFLSAIMLCKLFEGKSGNR